MYLASISEFDQERFYLLKHKIKQNKTSYIDMQENSVGWAGELVDHKSGKMKGWRYYDNDRIARMVVGEIYKNCNFNLEEAKSTFLAMNSTQIEPLIKHCVNEAARSDYWYTYEKIWD